MKKYISANIAIVRVPSDIITSSVGSGWNDEISTSGQLAPERYGRGRYDERYDQEYGL